MAITQVRGNTQIKPLTITNDEIDASADIETSKLADGAEFLWRDGSVKLTGDLDADGNKVTGLAAATDPTDAVRYDQVSGALFDEKVKVSSDDTTARYLSEKLLGTTGKITINTNNPAGDETYQITAGADLVDHTTDNLSVLDDGGGYVKMTNAERTSLTTEVALHDVTNEPTGFPNRTDSLISFSNGSLEFTIEPAGPPASFDYYIKGVKYTVSSADVVPITDTEGIWFIYYDGAVLTASQTWSDDIFTEMAFVAVVYWDQGNSVHILLLDERHGLTMDGATHEYLHNTVGTAYESGFDISVVGDAVPQPGTDADDGKIGLSNGSIYDEDIHIDITHAGTPTNPFEQILSPTAEIPIYIRYSSDASGIWRKMPASDVPFWGPNLGTPERAYWNNYNAGNWVIQECTDLYYVACFIFATNNIEEPIIAIMGQAQSASLDEARNVNTIQGLNSIGLPFKELRPLYRIIAQSNTLFSNKISLQGIRDLRTYDIIPGDEQQPSNPVFGSYFYSVSDPTDISTTSAWVSAVSLTTTVTVPIGTYRVGFYCECMMVSNNDETFQLRVNTGTILGILSSEFRTVITDIYESRSGFFYLTVTVPTVIVIVLQYGVNPAAKGPVHIRKKKLELWRVS